MYKIDVTSKKVEYKILGSKSLGKFQLPLKKSLTSRSPRVPDTSRSAPTDRTDNHNDNEAQHVNKQEVQRILGRLRKDREREKRKKEALMRFAVLHVMM